MHGYYDFNVNLVRLNFREVTLSQLSALLAQKCYGSWPAIVFNSPNTGSRNRKKYTKTDRKKGTQTHTGLIITYRNTPIKTYDHKTVALKIETEMTDAVC